MLKSIVFLLTITLAPVADKVPTVVGHSGGAYRLRNPLATPITVNFFCGLTWQEATFRVPAKTTELIRVLDEEGRGVDSCSMMKWYAGAKE